MGRLTAEPIRRVAVAVAFGMAALLAASAAQGQSFLQRYQAAFADRMSSHRDTAALSNFIGIAVEVGLYDQAISAIEQHLIDYPLDAEAHLVAGRLYNHLGSRELAHRHLTLALEMGTLGPRDERSARRLLSSVERALAGYATTLEFSAGIRSTSIGFAPAAPYRDRTDVDPFGRIRGQLRVDLETPRNDALVFSGEIGLSRRFGDMFFAGAGSTDAAPHGRAAVTYDIGLPIDLMPTLRGQLTAYFDHETFDSGVRRRIFGARARLMALPTADSFLYAETGYGWLGGSSIILLEQHRLSFEAGGILRIAGGHAVGIAARSQLDYRDGAGRVGHIHEAEISYGGELHSFASGPIWTHRAGLAAGDFRTPNVAAGPSAPFFGSYWRAYWNHSLQINDLSRVELYLAYQDSTFQNSPFQDRSRFDATLLYTFALY